MKTIKSIWFKLLSDESGLKFKSCAACYSIGTTDDTTIEVAKPQLEIKLGKDDQVHLAKYFEDYLGQVKEIEKI